MALYSASTRPVARGSGRSAVAAAAYRAGIELVDERTGKAHDYTRKGGVVSCDVITPDGRGADRAGLWNAAEAAEKRKDARTAREWIVALPAELDARQRGELARAFGVELAGRYGVAVDVAVHEPDRQGDQRNHHAHVLTTTRAVSRGEAGGLVFGDKTVLELSDSKRRKLGMGEAATEVTAIRGLWADLANQALERAGREERVDARSFAARGIDREATTHMGPVATDMERRGMPSNRGDDNRTAEANSQARAGMSAEIIDLAREREKRAKLARIESDRARLQAMVRNARPSLAPIAAAQPAPTAPAPPSAEAVIQRWTAEHQRQLAAVQERAWRIKDHAEGMEMRHNRLVETHRQTEPVAPRGLFMAFKQASHEAARRAWEKAGPAIHRRARQLTARVDRLRDYLQPVTQHTPHHPGDALAIRKIERERPELHKGYVEAVHRERVNQVDRVAEARERIRRERERERERDRGRDDRGRGR